MIREPYNVFPYNTTIDTSEEKKFSLTFNGDELGNYQYDIFENNQGGQSLFSQKSSNFNIYNEDTLSIVVDNKSLGRFVGKNLLWRITLWENNASFKSSNFSPVTANTLESNPKRIFIKESDAQMLASVDFSNPEVLVTIKIREERAKVVSVGSNYVEVDKAFSFLPQKAEGAVDNYIIYTNFNKDNPKDKITATIPILNGLTIDPKVIGLPIGGNKIHTGVIPAIDEIKDSQLQSDYIVNLDFGGDQVFRVKEYWGWTVLFDIEKEPVEEGASALTYKVTRTVTKYHEGKTLPPEVKVFTKVPDTEINWYREHDSDVGAYCVVAESGASIIDGTTFTAYRNYYETNYYFFKSRKQAQVMIDNFPTEQAKAFPTRFYRFVGSYQQRNNIPIKYHIWEVYKGGEQYPIYSTGRRFNSNLVLEYDNFLDKNSYHIKLIVENQEGAISSYTSEALIVLYDSVNFKTSGTVTYQKDTYSASVVWPDNRSAFPTQVKGSEASYNTTMYPGGDRKNLHLELGSEYRYDSLSGSKIHLDSSDFMLSTFITIDNDAKSPLWSGQILALESNPAGNKVALNKNGYGLNIVCSDDTANSSTYNFYKSKKVTEGTFITSKDKFSLLTLVPGQQGVEMPDGSIRKLTGNEKEGYAYNWKEEENNIPVKWNDRLYWTETESDTNIRAYKLLIYPSRAELYPMFKWTGTVKSSSGVQIEVGFSNLLTQKGTTSTALEIDGEVRDVVSYDRSTGFITVKEPFSKEVSGQNFFCYYKNAENAENDNIYVCDFSQRGQAPFNQVTLSGRVNYGYMVLYSESSFDHAEIHSILDYKYAPVWSNDNQNKILINCDFNGRMSSQYYESIQSRITGYRIYRNIYKNEDDASPIETKLIAELKENDLVNFRQGNFLKLTDYAIRNRCIFNYSILPITTVAVGAKIETNKIRTDWYEWVFTSLGKVAASIYRPLEQWVFRLDIKAGNIQHNVNKVFHQGFGRFPKVSVGRTNYITTSMSCLVSDLQYRVSYKDNYMYPALNGSITKSTSAEDSIKIYIEPTSIFNGINLNEQKAFLTINNQQRQIMSFSRDETDGRFFVMIDMPYTFLPTVGNKALSSYTVFTSYLPEGYSDVGVVERRYLAFDDSIERINAWNDFVSKDEPILVKDMKGNTYIAALSNNAEQSNIEIDDFPTTITFDITQIDDTEGYLIFDV